MATSRNICTFDDAAIELSPIGQWRVMLIGFLKRLLPVFVLAHGPHLWDNQAEVFGERQGSLHRVTASRGRHPQVLVVAVLGQKYKKSIWRKQCESYIMALFLSSLRVPRILSFVEIILAASPRSGQVLKSSIDIWATNPCKALYAPPYSAIGALYNRVDFPSWSEEVQGQTCKWEMNWCIPTWDKTQPGVDWGAVALPSNCSHHGRVEAVGHAVYEIPLLQAYFTFHMFGAKKLPC